MEDERLPNELVEQITRVQRAGGEALLVESLQGLSQRNKDAQVAAEKGFLGKDGQERKGGVG